MCTLLIRLSPGDDYPLAILSNRDEVYDRPSGGWEWRGEEGQIFAPIDIQAGGSWIGFNDKGVALNPYYSFEYLITYGLAYYTLGQYAKAAAVLEQAQTRNANNVVVKYLLCASYVRLGRLNDAQWVADELQFLTPTATLANVERNFPLANNDTKKALLADLSSAGLRH